MNLEDFYGKTIPILNWVFFVSKKEAYDTFNSSEFDGWNDDWLPVATDQLGDIIVVNGKNQVGYINHEERVAPCFNLINKEVNDLDAFLNNLIKIEDYSNVEDISSLRDIKKKLLELRKAAPRNLKEYFSYETEELQEKINDIRFYSTKDGKIIKALEEYSHAVLGEQRMNNRYLGISIEKDFESKDPEFIVSGWLEEGETLEEFMSILKNYEPPYPLNIRKIYTYEEVMQARANKT